MTSDKSILFNEAKQLWGVLDKLRSEPFGSDNWRLALEELEALEMHTQSEAIRRRARDAQLGAWPEGMTVKLVRA